MEGKVRERRPANSEMIDGYKDGLDLSNPEPSENRSYSYRHGFNAGRNDKLNGNGPFHGMSFENIISVADEAMAKDDAA